MNKRNLAIMIFLLICLSLFFILYTDNPIKNMAKKDNPAHIATIVQPTMKHSADLSLKNNLLTDLIYIRHTEIVAIGDSITAGVGDEEKNGGYVGILKDIMNTDNHIVNFTNFGKNGNRTDQLLERLTYPEIIEKLEIANNVLITIGANDVKQVFEENFLDLQLEHFVDAQEGFEDRLAEIFRTIQGINPHATIYLIGFYNPFKTFFPDIDELDHIVESWNELGETVTEQFNDVHFIPIRELFGADTADNLSADKFHLNHQGYERMAAQILKYLTSKEGYIHEEK